MVVVSLTQDGHTISILQSGQAKCYSIADTQRLRSKARDDVTGRWDQDQYHSKGMISGIYGPWRNIEPLLLLCLCLIDGYDKCYRKIYQ